MLITEMSTNECQEFLLRIGVGRLACTNNNQPYIVPMYFAYESDNLYAFSTVGRKIEWMRVNPRVCVEVDEITNQSSWTSVILAGRYQELPETPEWSSERNRAYKLLEKRTLWWATAHAARQLQVGHEPFLSIFYCIHIDTMTGHRAAPNPIKSDEW